MELPRLRVRPKSTQTTTVFRGLERRPGAGVGRWLDERNLSADRAPVMTARKARKQVTNIDGNTLDNMDAGQISSKVVAMCGGDHLVLLDETGTFWCNGHSVNVPAGSDEDKCLRWYWTIDKSQMRGDVNVTVTPAEGYDTSFQTFNGLGLDGQTVLWPRICFRCIDEQDPGWVYDKGTNRTTWYPCDLSDFNITVTGDNWLDGVEVWLEQYSSSTGLLKPGHTLVRMGATVIDPKLKVWVNAVSLASGQEMVEGEDYGYLEAQAGNMSGESLTMTLCDIDGNPYNGVVVQTSEPATQSGYWLDTSQTKPVLRQWNSLSAAWIVISSTFVRVGPFTSYETIGPVKKGDAVQVTQTNGGADAQQLLQGTHYLYNVIYTSPDIYDVVISGILSDDQVADGNVECGLERKVPDMDFVVEAQNRLWGCRYSLDDGINEIYASKLGDYTNWEVYQGLSTDSWRASRGSNYPFTGAAALDGKPLFFREESLEKVFPSASGAHQIATYDLEGVQEGSADSLCVIEDRLFYKSRQGVMVYAGTMPQRISEPFGEWQFSEATAARHGRKYCISMKGPGTDPSTPLRSAQDDGGRLCAVFDLATGDWHLEDEAWEGKAVTWEDDLYYIADGKIIQMDGADGSEGVSWWAETQNISHDLPEHKWISYLRLRFKLELGAAARVYISYDDGPWLRKGTLHGNRLHSQELGIWPRRCDHFRLRLEGCGGCELQSISYRMERSEGGH